MKEQRRTHQRRQDPELEVALGHQHPHRDIGQEHHRRAAEGAGAQEPRGLGADERVALFKAYIGDRTNRRHKPGRAFERTFYRFDVPARGTMAHMYIMASASEEEAFRQYSQLFPATTYIVDTYDIKNTM